MLDATDRQIIELLQDNSRRKIREIAEQVHLTAPAVSARIQKLEEQGVIRRYTVDIDREKTGCAYHTLVTVTLKTGKKSAYLAYIAQFAYHIGWHYRTAGLGCYVVEVYFETKRDLAHFLDGLEAFASYQLSSVVDAVD